VTDKWRHENGLQYFEKKENDPSWREHDKSGKPAFAFTFVSRVNNDVLLFDKSRGYYIKLTNQHALLGTDKENVNGLLMTGKWEIKDKIKVI
jgi:hypothetical protein